MTSPLIKRFNVIIDRRVTGNHINTRPVCLQEQHKTQSSDSVLRVFYLTGTLPRPTFIRAVLKSQTPPELSSMTKHSKLCNILQSVRIDGLLNLQFSYFDIFRDKQK